jgi:hypothetical protein
LEERGDLLELEEGRDKLVVRRAWEGERKKWEDFSSNRDDDDDEEEEEVKGEDDEANGAKKDEVDEAREELNAEELGKLEDDEDDDEEETLASGEVMDESIEREEMAISISLKVLRFCWRRASSSFNAWILTKTKTERWGNGRNKRYGNRLC